MYTLFLYRGKTYHTLFLLSLRFSSDVILLSGASQYLQNCKWKKNHYFLQKLHSLKWPREKQQRKNNCQFGNGWFWIFSDLILNKKSITANKDNQTFPYEKRETKNLFGHGRLPEKWTGIVLKWMFTTYPVPACWSPGHLFCGGFSVKGDCDSTEHCLLYVEGSWCPCCWPALRQWSCKQSHSSSSGKSRLQTCLWAMHTAVTEEL